MSGPQSEKVKKDLQVLFKKFGLNLIIVFNKTTDDYLEITLNSLDGTYKLNQKPGSTLQYIHKESNHPPYIIKQIIMTIETRLSNHSSNETVFRHAAEDYEKALKKSGYNVKLQYKPTNQNPKNKINRKRNIIWLNPPFSKSVSTKIGHYFLNLLDKHFPKNHKFHNIFNGNSVKVSYSCTKKIKSIITNHNKMILNESETSNWKKCNSIYKNACPLNGECQTENIIYSASLNSNKLNYDKKYHTGSCETTFRKTICQS